MLSHTFRCWRQCTCDFGGAVSRKSDTYAETWTVYVCLKIIAGGMPDDHHAMFNQKWRLPRFLSLCRMSILKVFTTLKPELKLLPPAKNHHLGVLEILAKSFHVDPIPSDTERQNNIVISVQHEILSWNKAIQFLPISEQPPFREALCYFAIFKISLIKKSLWLKTLAKIDKVVEQMLSSRVTRV